MHPLWYLFWSLVAAGLLLLGWRAVKWWREPSPPWPPPRPDLPGPDEPWNSETLARSRLGSQRVLDETSLRRQVQLTGSRALVDPVPDRPAGEQPPPGYRMPSPEQVAGEDDEWSSIDD